MRTMKPTSGTTTSVWMATADPPLEKTLNQDTSTNVVIVGAGIAGLTTAYLLARSGKAVLVLDDGPIGGGMTARTTANLTCALDDRFYELERLFGEDGSRLAGQSHAAAIDEVERIVHQENIDCEFQRTDGYLFLSPSGTHESLNEELAAAHRADLTQVQRIDRVPVDFWDSGPCLHFPRQAQFHPLKYLTGLTQAIERDGGQVFTNTHASDISGGEAAHVITASGYTIPWDTIVVANHCPVNAPVVIHTKHAPYTNYVIGPHI